MACPICGSDAQVSAVRRTYDGREAHHIPCERCGVFFATEEAVQDLPGTLRGDIERVTRVAHGVRRMQHPTRPPILTNEMIDRLLQTPLPSVFEQADLLLRWIGEQSAGPGEFVELITKKHLFVVGAKSWRGLAYLVTHLLAAGDIEGAPAIDGSGQLKASFKGWERLDKIRRGAADSRKAFMAMRYGDATLDRIVNDFFRPAVVQTGFTLSRLDDLPKAGLIDDRLRVEIRRSRFLIADLTHDNLGAYWESGFAEGLDKPVIYTCDRGKFEVAKTHFDTNHHLTVVWDAADPAAAAEQLKATIRATLPTEAKQTD